MTFRTRNHIFVVTCTHVRELIHKSQEWFCELKESPMIEVPRCLQFGPEEIVLSETLHIDALVL